MKTGFQLEDPRSADPCSETVSSLPHCADSEAPLRWFDPCSTDIRTLTVRARSHWTLDDMHRLSEAIVRNRGCPK